MPDDRPIPPPWRLPRGNAATVRDLRGGARLAADGLHRAIDSLEYIHRRLAVIDPPVRGLHVPSPQRGWPALLYGGLRGTAALLGSSLDLALASLQASMQDPGAGRAAASAMPAREAAVAALNALVGDHLHRSDNPLAIDFELRQRGTPGRPRVLVLVHDLGLDDLQWQQQGRDHAQALADALDCTQLRVHYNSGRHAWVCGRQLAAELETRLARWPVPLQEVALIGHGLGGLVLRSALEQAARTGLAWPALVRHLVFLGTPLQGAGASPARWPFAPQGLSAQALLGPLARLAARRSEGMRDFSEGRHLEPGLPPLTADPWPPDVRAHAVAGSGESGLDDGLVPVASALAQDQALPGQLPLAPADRWIAPGTSHLGLLADEAVQQQVRRWLAT